jgi:hypothetical protein
VPARLAAAASGEDLGVLEHARECLSCRAELIEQRQLIDAARRLARPSLRAEHRAALAAEVMAIADAGDAQQPWRGERVMTIAASLVAAAAVVTLVFAAGGPSAHAPASPSVALVDEPVVQATQRAHLDAVAAPLRAEVVATGVFARVQRGDEDVVTLRHGEVSIDATDRDPVTVVAGDTKVTVGSRAKVVARHGVIVTTQVFAGTAHVTTSGGRQQVIDAGDVWMREADASPASVSVTDSLAAFRTGWEELRAHHHPQAIAAFDRATDPVVAEDAAFWAAIATERAGDSDGAATRLRAFLDRFPSSPRAEAARAALERVTR